MRDIEKKVENYLDKSSKEKKEPKKSECFYSITHSSVCFVRVHPTETDTQAHTHTPSSPKREREREQIC